MTEMQNSKKKKRYSFTLLFNKFNVGQSLMLIYIHIIFYHFIEKPYESCTLYEKK